MSIRFIPNAITASAVPKNFKPTPRPRFLRHANNANDRLRVAVLGGGVTGLATAYRLAEDPSTDVTLFEKSSRLGGWLSSERIEVDGGSVLFEWGPRTLRAGSGSAQMSTVELLLDLGLRESILRTSKRSPAACNRYIYYPDRLVRLPGPRPAGKSFVSNFFRNATNILTEPLLRELVTAFVYEHRIPARNSSVEDESIGDFISRRFSPDVADHIASAVGHGILAGDIYKLSTRAWLPLAWKYEMYEGRITGTMAIPGPGETAAPSDGVEYLRTLVKERGGLTAEGIRRFGSESSVLTVKDGMGQIAGRLEGMLTGMDNVKVKTGTEVERIRKKEGGLAISAPNTPETRYDYVVSTIPSTSLAEPLSSNNDCPLTPSLLRQNSSAVTVMVINLYYPTPNLIRQRGFGYLIPRSIPLDQNPERGLGVIFASESSAGQDTAPGTKLTVMLGGHWWDGWTASDLPDEQAGIEMAQSLLKRHLGITANPVVAKAKLQRECIPQYTVGHAQRMIALHEALEDEYNCRLKVAGAWYGGVGVNDCVKSARLVAAGVHSQRPALTGLEKYVRPFAAPLKVNAKDE